MPRVTGREVGAVTRVALTGTSGRCPTSMCLRVLRHHVPLRHTRPGPSIGRVRGWQRSEGRRRSKRSPIGR